MKVFKRIILIFLTVLFCVFISFNLYIKDKYVVPILMYHSIFKADTYKPNEVSSASFNFQMGFLKTKGYDVLSLDQYVEKKLNREKFSRKSVVITFDDGYVDNYTVAYQILKKYGFPATIFMPSDKVDLEERLTESQIKEMLVNRITIGSHTRTECYLPDADENQLYDEIVNSKKILEERFSIKVDYIAYCKGGFSDQIKQMVKNAGYKAALTTNRGFDKTNTDLFEINRIRISDRDTNNIMLWAKLSGYYNLFRKTKSPY